MEFADQLDALVADNAPKLRLVTPDDASRRPGAGRWSKKEVIGHLIDSASNNHQRYVRAQFVDELTFPPYQQNDWVDCQRYSESDWHELLDLWVAYNRHLAHVMRVMPPQRLSVLCHLHWGGVPKVLPLRSVMEEYLRHMRHHLERVLH